MAISGRLRVIGGELRGRRLVTIRGHALRPTGDRVREALFDILGRSVIGADFLDAYAGTGAIGIEALSRGAATATFIEQDPAAAGLVQRNLALVGLADSRARLLSLDIGDALARLEREARRFDLLFVDPPYEGVELERALDLISLSPVMATGATLVAEHDARRDAPSPLGLVKNRTTTYGRAALTFFGRGGSR